MARHNLSSFFFTSPAFFGSGVVDTGMSTAPNAIFCIVSSGNLDGKSRRKNVR